MCAIISLIINDYFGGDICKIYVDEINHYFNIIDDKIIDLTSSQFNHDVAYKDYQIMEGQKILTDDAKNKYNILKTRLIKKLLKQVDEKVYFCKSCDKYYNELTYKVIDFCERNNIEYHIKNKTITEEKEKITA